MLRMDFHQVKGIELSKPTFIEPYTTSDGEQRPGFWVRDIIVRMDDDAERRIACYAHESLKDITVPGDPIILPPVEEHEDSEPDPREPDTGNPVAVEDSRVFPAAANLPEKSSDDATVLVRGVPLEHAVA